MRAPVVRRIGLADGPGGTGWGVGAAHQPGAGRGVGTSMDADEQNSRKASGSLRSRTWVWVAGMLVGGPVAFFVIGAILAANDPEFAAKTADRRRFELCMKDLADPLKSAVTKEIVIAPVCERFRADFRNKYGTEP